MGFSSTMGPKLRALVEKQLLEDLKHYDLTDLNLKFDWSKSCIEGNDTVYLDGSLENYSGISLYNENDELVADGWMEFIHTESHFIVYWDHLLFRNHHPKEKVEFGIPNHIKEYLKLHNIPY